MIGVAAGVAQQVAHHHLQHPRRRVQLRPGVGLQLQPHRLVAQQEACAVGLGLDPLADVEPFALRLHIDVAGQDQEGVDHRFHFPSRILDPAQAALHPRRQVRFLQGHVAGQPDHGQGGAQFVAGVAGEGVFALDLRLHPLTQGIQGASQLPGLALHVRRQPLRRQHADVRMARIPARDHPRQPGHRRDQPVGCPVGQPGRAVDREQRQHRRQHRKPQCHPGGLFAQVDQVQGAGRLPVHPHQLAGIDQIVEARRQRPQLRRHRQVGVAGLHQVAAQGVGIGGRLHRRGLVQFPVVPGLVLERGLDEAVLEQRGHHVERQQDRQAGQGHLHDEGDPYLPGQAVVHRGAPAGLGPV